MHLGQPYENFSIAGHSEEAPQEDMEPVLLAAIAGLDNLPEDHRVRGRRAMFFLLLWIHHRREPEERARLFSAVTDAVRQSHRKEVEEMVMTSAQALMEEGRQEGLQQGQSELLLELLAARFGALPERVITAVKGLPLGRLKELALQVLTAQSLADLPLESQNRN